MKKCITLLLAFALVVVLSQCKKKVETIQSVPSVYITLDVEGGDKAIVDPHGGSNYATVTFEQGDIIWVGNNGAYCGYLTYNGTTGSFEGEITPTSDDNTDYLHFYFMGGYEVRANDNLANNIAPAYVRIYDQAAKYPVISYGRSTNLYSSTNQNYSATLQNYCSIMKFPIAGAGTDKAVTIMGMNNYVTVDFSKNKGSGDPVNPYSYYKEGSGSIVLHSENANEKWAIVLPQSAVDAYIHVYGYDAQAVSVPAISTNEYHNNDIGNITLTPVTSSHFTEALFTVDANDTKVIFSPGNLRYNKATDKFSFMEHQYSFAETRGQDVGIDYANQNIVSLFGWGTSGWNNGNTFYQPYNTSNDATYPNIPTNGYGYGPKIANTVITSLTGNYANADWGVYNKQSNQNKIEGGGDHAWRTLTGDEWDYLIKRRNTASGRRYAKATVCGMIGLVVLPDNWSDATYALNEYNYYMGPFDVNIIDANGWATLESAGCVFLPAAGCRVNTKVSGVGDEYGTYWASTLGSSDSGMADLIDFSRSFVTTTGFLAAYQGSSVRLVYDVQ